MMDKIFSWPTVYILLGLSVAFHILGAVLTATGH